MCTSFSWSSHYVWVPLIFDFRHSHLSTLWLSTYWLLTFRFFDIVTSTLRLSTFWQWTTFDELNVINSHQPSVISFHQSTMTKRMNAMNSDARNEILLKRNRRQRQSISAASPAVNFVVKSTILVFPYEILWRNLDGIPLTWASNAGGAWKIALFDQYLALSRKWYKTLPQLL